MKRDRGFTLLELLVSVTVMFTLSAISVANYQNYKKNINHTIAQIDTRNMIAAFNASLIDFNFDDTAIYTISKQPGATTASINGGSKTLDQLLPGASFNNNIRYWVYINYECLTNPPTNGLNCGALSVSITPCNGVVVDIPGMGTRQRSWFYAESNSLSGVGNFGPTDNSYGNPLVC